MSLVDVCHCGHDRATHFEQKHTCLGMHCDDCVMFIHRDDRDRPERRPQPKPRQWSFDDLSTDPIPTPRWPWP